MLSIGFFTNPSSFVLGSARGPLSSMPAMDVMWVSFYSIGALLLASIIVSVARKYIHNGILLFIVQLLAFGLFIFGAYLMVLVVLTWPS